MGRTPKRNEGVARISFAKGKFNNCFSRSSANEERSITQKIIKQFFEGKGKSGGLRIITYVEAEVVETEETIEVFLLSIYNKSDYENVSQSFIKDLIEDVLEGTTDNDPSEEEG